MNVTSPVITPSRDARRDLILGAEGAAGAIS